MEYLLLEGWGHGEVVEKDCEELMVGGQWIQLFGVALLELVRYLFHLPQQMMGDPKMRF